VDRLNRVKLMQRSPTGLMDVVPPLAQIDQVEALQAGYRKQGVDFDAPHSRQAGSRAFVILQGRAPGHGTVRQRHDVAKRSDADNRQGLPHARLTAHLEPPESSIFMGAQEFDRALD
jgi:hypothetical protein